MTRQTGFTLQTPRLGYKQNALRSLLPGSMLALTLAFAASYLAGSLGGPVMLYALLLGMAFNFLNNDQACLPGIAVASKTLLRFGVALLGARITLVEVAELGLPTALLVVSGVLFTLTIGSVIGKLLGLRGDYAVLSAGAVAICGASAALAISSVLPNHKAAERQLCITILGVTTLSTLAMVLYPAIATGLGLNDVAAGVFLGATIHDVAQVIGAGYMLSDTAGETATVTKLMRIACLVPAVVAIGLVFRKTPIKTERSPHQPPHLPTFLIGFIALMACNSIGLVPPAAASVMTEGSRWCLVTAVAALGVKTSVKDFVAVGARPIVVLIAQTSALALFGLLAVIYLIPALSS